MISQANLATALCQAAEQIIDTGGLRLWQNLRPKGDSTFPMEFGIVFDTQDHKWCALLLITNVEAQERLARTAKIHGYSREEWTLKVFLEGDVLPRSLDKTMQKAMYCDDTATMYLGASGGVRALGLDALVVVGGVALPAIATTARPNLMGNAVRLTEHLLTASRTHPQFRDYVETHLA